jgi:hypothetical protein
LTWRLNKVADKYYIMEKMLNLLQLQWAGIAPVIELTTHVGLEIYILSLKGPKTLLHLPKRCAVSSYSELQVQHQF